MAGSPSASPALDRRLKRFLVWAILLLTAGFTFLDYWEYSRVQHADPASWALLASGRGLAPAQYRIGVYYTANFFAQLTHLQFRHTFAVADFFCTALALSCIFYLLTRVERFRNASLSAQWAQALLALLLTQIYLVWTLWFQEPETMPSLAILAVSALLCWGLTRDTAPFPRPMLALALLLVALLGATIRVDAVTAFASGMLVACLDAKKLPSGRAWLAATSLAALATASAIEHFIAHEVFPHAVRSAPLLQLVDNLHAVNGMLALLCTLPPWLLTIWLAARAWSSLPLWLRGLVVGSALHFVMFVTFGMSEEVRIFLPFTLVLIPLSATLLYRWLAGEQESPEPLVL